MTIDWSNPHSLISAHFTVIEALYLPKWQVCHIPSEEEKANILVMAHKMDRVRDFLNLPITIHCWLRPILNNPASPHHGEDYNKLVGGAKSSAHRNGCAVDWDAGEDCNLTRTKLIPMLEPWNMRMEDIQGPWVHLDDAPVPQGGHRFFKP